MPNNSSTKKRLRQNVAHRLRNRSVKSLLRKGIREVREAVAAGNVDEAEAKYQIAAKRLDKAGSSSLIHPNKAARTKSRLQALIKKSK